ncbi:MAG: toll/interleukin-1 receptor domain-containing protein [Bacteroidota bacterium]
MPFDCYAPKGPLNTGETRYDEIKRSDQLTFGLEFWQGPYHNQIITGEWNHESLMEEKRQKLNKKRVFISHRQKDKTWSLAFAAVLQAHGIDYWLDICDPRLSNPHKKLPPIGIANIIEIALINSTHVVALISKNSAGSAWIPYEYGRIKSPNSHIGNVCAYNCLPSGRSLPEYMQLSKVGYSDMDVVQWIQQTPIR